MLYGVLCMVYDVRCSLYADLSVVYGVGCSTYGVRFMRYDV